MKLICLALQCGYWDVVVMKLLHKLLSGDEGGIFGFCAVVLPPGKGCSGELMNGQENLVSILIVEGLQHPLDDPQPVICIQRVHIPAKSGWLCSEKFRQLLIHALGTGPLTVHGVGYGFQQPSLVIHHFHQVYDRWRGRRGLGVCMNFRSDFVPINLLFSTTPILLLLWCFCTRVSTTEPSGVHWGHL